MPRGNKPPSQRQLRVGEELRHIIAAVIERGEFRDPDLVGRGITVTEVRVSPDLRNATVFVVPLGGGDTTPILSGLKRAKAFLRHEIGKSALLRTVPDLWFQPDTTFDEASRIDDILRSPEVLRDLEGGEGA
ncbi:30S ribosome-binding factor RbfA [Magnetospirillum fulvum]|jgi:ribosome-binding factor A|uniref:Ribosome-binding factor A n=1 Tax=Magnetospirillum fulvum MGU-K5 TaxID=1316936 RepID=S9SBZ9_MAGFU|nr:30S ribosome-binding factor RbfA [Magnetospirillum fulvum]EPY03437.1 ribosome-binding factor A [Magnetospirillum fulvum MGU-K5]